MSKSVCFFSGGRDRSFSHLSLLFRLSIPFLMSLALQLDYRQGSLSLSIFKICYLLFCTFIVSLITQG